MPVFDTNVLVYATDEDSEFHEPCRELVENSRQDPSPSFLTWGICYEFLGVVTQPTLARMRWDPEDAWGFLYLLLSSRGFSVLAPTARHPAVLAQTLTEVEGVRGNMMHDLHTAVLMREHGLREICTRDAGFHRFPFLTVIDPLR